MRMIELFAVCAPGLEEATVEELTEAGAAVGEVETGGVTFQALQADATRIGLALRTAVRVLRRLATFPATSRAALAAGLADVQVGSASIAGFKVTARKSKLHHTGLIEEVARRTLRVGDDGETVYLRLLRDECTVSVTVGGDRLDHRGWRTDVGPAPLRESVAAAIVRLSGWDRRSPLLDPMCGSGVIPIEAALWASESGDAPAVVGLDARPEAIASARRHAAAAGPEAAGITWEIGDLASAGATIPNVLVAPSTAGRPGRPAVVTNPPWGKRLAPGREAREVYADLGRLLRRLKGGRAAVVTPQGGAAKDLEGTLGRGPARVIPFRHGGQPVALRIYERLGARSRARRR